MQNAGTVLGVLRERGRRGLPCDELYRQLFNPQLYLLAYGRIYAHQGAMTPGVDGETADGTSLARIGCIIDALRHERYRFKPARRMYIPKKNGRKRPLGLPSWSDKLVGEVICLLLEAYYEPQFSDRSYGFRPGRGCHTALRKVADTWTGTTWFIEGDISDCFGSLDHEIMIRILAEKISDNRFLRLLRNMLKAGYLEDWKWNATLSGVPQGGVVAPPTQVRTWGRLRVGVTVRAGGDGCGCVCPGGDGVADHDLAGTDEDFPDEQAHDALTVPGGRGGRGFAERGQEVLEVLGQLEVDLAVGELGVEGLGLMAQAGLACAQFGHPGTEFVEGQEVFLVCADQPGDRAGGLGEGVVEALALGGGRVGGADLGEALVNLGADQGRVGEQAGDVIPHDLVEIVGADGLAAADLAVLEPVVVAADAPVVEDLVASGGRVGVR